MMPARIRVCQRGQWRTDPGDRAEDPPDEPASERSEPAERDDLVGGQAGEVPSERDLAFERAAERRCRDP